MALPPRKVDAYTFGLGCAWVCCANEAARFHTGRSLLESIGRNPPPPKLLPQKGGIPGEMRRGWLGERVYSQLHPPQPGDGGGGGNGGSARGADGADSEAKRTVGQAATRSGWDVAQKRDGPELERGASNTGDRGKRTS